MTNPSRAEPFAGREDVSLPAHAADLGARQHKEAGSVMEPAKSREIAMMAAKLPSQALPQSLEAAKLGIITVSTRLWEYPSALANRARSFAPYRAAISAGSGLAR